MNDCIRLTAPLELKPASGDKLSQNVKGVAYSGGKVQQYESLVIDLASTTLAKDMPLLFQHRSGKRESADKGLPKATIIRFQLLSGAAGGMFDGTSETDLILQ